MTSDPVGSLEQAPLKSQAWMLPGCLLGSSFGLELFTSDRQNDIVRLRDDNPANFGCDTPLFDSRARSPSHRQAEPDVSQRYISLR